jgi:hypothetical protein
LEKGGRRNQGKSHHDAPPATGAPREDTVRNVRSPGHYSVRYIPVTVITVSEIQQTGMGIDLCSQTEEDSRVRQEEVNVSIFLSRNRENRRTQKTEEDWETTEGENVDLLAGLLELVSPGMTRGERQGDRELREGVVLIIV